MRTLPAENLPTNLRKGGRVVTNFVYLRMYLIQVLTYMIICDKMYSLLVSNVSIPLEVTWLFP